MLGEVLHTIRKASRFTKIAGSLAVASAFVSGCSTPPTSAEQNAMNSDQWRVFLEDSKAFGPVNCFTNTEPTIKSVPGKTEVIFPDTTYCFDENNGASTVATVQNRRSMGIPTTNPLHGLDIVVDEIVTKSVNNSGASATPNQ
jgi:hypothetical protein